MAHCLTFLEETGSILDIPLVPESGSTIGLNFGAGEVANMDHANWPLITLYRSISLPAPDDLTDFYLRVLTLNADLDGVTLACDEAGVLHLLQSFDATFQTPADLAESLKQFATWGTQIPGRFATLESPAESSSNHEAPNYEVRAYSPADHHFLV